MMQADLRSHFSNPYTGATTHETYVEYVTTYYDLDTTYSQYMEYATTIMGRKTNEKGEWL